MPTEPSVADLLIARRTKRKVDGVVTKTYRQFRKIIAEEETLSVDEILAIGINLLMMVMVRPLEKMSADPRAMRMELVKQCMLIIEAGSEERN